MKLGYFADGRWSHLALERIVADKRFEVAFIVPRFETRDPVLRQWAEKLNVPFLLVPKVNASESRLMLAAFGVDLFVSMSFNQIFKHHFLQIPPRGVINCHAGALPFYRGRNVLNWALINDEHEFGVTVHYVDTAIDTGDIIVQRKEPICDRDSYGTVLDRAVEICAETLHEALVKIAEGSAERRSQASIHPVGFYVGGRTTGDEWIDWNWSSRRIFNFVRAIAAPGPGARTALGASEVIIEEAEIIPNAPTYIATIGEIVAVRSQTQFVVKTGDATLSIKIKSVTPPIQIRVGVRFLSKHDWQLAQLQQRVERLEATVDAICANKAML